MSQGICFYPGKRTLNDVYFSGKRYNIVKYLSVLLIVIGVALFMYKDGKSDGSGFSFGSGEMLLLTSLTLGGLT